MVGTSRTQGITYSEHAAIGDFWLLLAVVSFFFFFNKFKAYILDKFETDLG